MPKITIYGASDDLIETDGPTWYDGQVNEGREELNGLTSGHPGCTQLFIIDPKSGPQMSIWAIYDGCWSFAPGLVYDETGSGAHRCCESVDGCWAITHARSADCGHSKSIQIDVPDGHFVALASDLGAICASLAEAPW